MEDDVTIVLLHHAVRISTQKKEERLKKVTKHKANKCLLESLEVREERLQKIAKLKTINYLL